MDLPARSFDPASPGVAPPLFLGYIWSSSPTSATKYTVPACISYRNITSIVQIITASLLCIAPSADGV